MGKTLLARLQALLGQNFTRRDLEAAWASDPDKIRSVGGSSWSIARIQGAEFETREQAEAFRDETAALFPHRRLSAKTDPAIERPKSNVLGLHGFVA